MVVCRQFHQPLPLALAALCAVLVGCAPPKTRIEINDSARSDEASRVRRIAVLPFVPLNGSDITGDVETMLAGIVVKERRFFDVVERQRTDLLLKEMKLVGKGLLDDKTASQIGRMLAANGIYTGRILRSDWADQRYSESRKVCTQYEQKRDKKGATYDGACLRWRDAQAQCVLRTANFEFAPKLISVEKGTILYSRSHGSEAKSSACNEPGGQGNTPLADGNQLLADARLKALESLRRDVAPSTRVQSVDLLDSADRIASAAAKERFKGAVEFAKAERMDRACEMWREVAATETRSPELTYNLGVCSEMSGNLDQALSMYDSADRMTGTPNRTIGAALARVQKLRQDKVKLDSQLRR